jgi:cell division septation protein DedD
MAAGCVAIAATLHASETITVSVRGAAALQIAGATAAYAVDSSIADASVAGGIVTVVGRSVGTTQVVVVAAGGATNYSVVVRPRPGTAVAPKAASASSPNRASFEARYSTSQSQLHNSIEVVRQQGTKKTELRATTAVSGDGRGATFRFLSWRRSTPGREITLFDDVVENSPLTIDGMNVRGVHVRQGNLALHAGYASFPVSDSLLIPRQRDLAAGMSYVWRDSRGSKWMPSVYVYPGRGSVASLTYDLSRGESLSLRAEGGWGGALGGAVQLAAAGARQRARLDVRYRPREFATATNADLHGFFADGSWGTELGRFSADAAFSVNRYELEAFDQDSATFNAESRWRASDAFTLTAGATYGSFSQPGIEPVSSYSIPFGVRAHFARGGFVVQPRYSANTATNEGGFGFRVSGNALLRAVRVGGYFDRERQAPTVQLIFRDLPELALALEQLGISATSPQDIARLLRENSSLLGLGLIEGASIELTPTRTQAGLEAAWLGSSDARHQLRLRLLYNLNESVRRETKTAMSTLSYSRRIGSLLDIYGAFTTWQTWTNGRELDPQQFLEVGFRRRFDGTNGFLPKFGTGTISGMVFRDDDATGVMTSGGVAAVEVALDETQRTLTDADGKYAFRNVKRGAAHSVVARVVDDGGAFFTTRSSAEAQAGDVVNFGVSVMPARILGIVTSDDGRGVAGVTITASNGERRVTGVTASDGRFTIATAPGVYELSIDSGTLPPGYSAAADARRVTIERDKPMSGAAFAVRANRSVSGTVAPNVEVEIVELKRKTRSDAKGAYAFRSLPPGELTLVARAGGKTLQRRVTVPSSPTTLRDVDLGDLGEAVTTREPLPPVAIAEGDAWMVQLGAFRVISNATGTVAKARKAGVEPLMVKRAGLTFVELGPFRTRADAEARKQALEASGVEAVVRPTTGR